MKNTHGFVTGLVMGALCLLAAPISQGQVLSIDMDLVTGGIQDVRSVTSGQNFSVGLILAPAAGGVSSYGISVRFDNAELSLNGSPTTTTSPPGGFGFTDFGVLGGESANIGGGLGQVGSISAGTLGSGPTSGEYTIATINFTAGTVSADLADITPGDFSAIFDSIFDNAGTDVTGSYTFESGAVVPEPAATGLALGLAAAGAIVWRGFGRARKRPGAAQT